jgi:hypothetical protein
MVTSVTSALILLPFLTVAQHESGTSKATYWSVTVYNKKLFRDLVQINYTFSDNIHIMFDNTTFILYGNTEVYIYNCIVHVYLKTILKI